MLRDAAGKAMSAIEKERRRCARLVATDPYGDSYVTRDIVPGILAGVTEWPKGNHIRRCDASQRDGDAFCDKQKGHQGPHWDVHYDVEWRR